jgi:hypothetical protein
MQWLSIAEEINKGNEYKREWGGGGGKKKTIFVGNI